MGSDKITASAIYTYSSLNATDTAIWQYVGEFEFEFEFTACCFKLYVTLAIPECPLPPCCLMINLGLSSGPSCSLRPAHPH